MWCCRTLIHRPLLCAATLPQGQHVMRSVGVVTDTDGGPDDAKALADLSFQPGDYLDVAIYT